MFHIKLPTQHAREGPPEIAVCKMCSDGNLNSLECKLMPREFTNKDIRNCNQSSQNISCISS